MRMPYRTIVYEQDGSYFAQDSFGVLLQSMINEGNAEPLDNPNTDPALIIQAALNRQGDLYIADGSYQFNLDFQGLNVRNFGSSGLVMLL